MLNSSQGSFRSIDANGNGLYENNLDCIWTILVGGNKIVKLNIDNFNVENHQSCIYDYLKVCIESYQMKYFLNYCPACLGGPLPASVVTYMYL